MGKAERPIPATGPWSCSLAPCTLPKARSFPRSISSTGASLGMPQSQHRPWQTPLLTLLLFVPRGGKGDDASERILAILARNSPFAPTAGSFGVATGLKDKPGDLTDQAKKNVNPARGIARGKKKNKPKPRLPFSFRQILGQGNIAGPIILFTFGA